MRVKVLALAVALALLAGGAWAVGANWFGGQATITNAAAVNLATALSIATTKNAKQLTIRIDPTSSNTIYCGPSTVTTVPAAGRIAISVGSGLPSYTWAPGGGSSIDPAAIWCIATTADTLAFVDGLE